EKSGAQKQKTHLRVREDGFACIERGLVLRKSSTRALPASLVALATSAGCRHGRYALRSWPGSMWVPPAAVNRMEVQSHSVRPTDPDGARRSRIGPPDCQRREPSPS